MNTSLLFHLTVLYFVTFDALCNVILSNCLFSITFDVISSNCFILYDYCTFSNRENFEIIGDEGIRSLTSFIYTEYKSVYLFATDDCELCVDVTNIVDA